MDELEQFRVKCGLRSEDVVFYPHGSRVYGTYTEESDHDFLAVVASEWSYSAGTEFCFGNVDIQAYSKLDFRQILDQHKIHALEAYFLDDVVCTAMFPDWRLDLQTLRHELLAKSSHSFVKAKKKIEVERDFYRGRKSLFHSLRILLFGIQIATQGRIVDYRAASHYWHDIMLCGDCTWDELKQKYQPVHNALASELRKLAPKMRSR